MPFFQENTIKKPVQVLKLLAFSFFVFRCRILVTLVTIGNNFNRKWA